MILGYIRMLFPKPYRNQSAPRRPLCEDWPSLLFWFCTCCQSFSQHQKGPKHQKTIIFLLAWNLCPSLVAVLANAYYVPDRHKYRSCCHGIGQVLSNLLLKRWTIPWTYCWSQLYQGFSLGQSSLVTAVEEKLVNTITENHGGCHL